MPQLRRLLRLHRQGPRLRVLRGLHRDPGDPTRTLDTWYEVAFVKDVPSIDALLAELSYALSLEKTVSRS